MKKQDTTKKEDLLYAHFVDLILVGSSMTKGLSFEQIASTFCRAIFECGFMAGEFELQAKRARKV